MVRVVLLSLPPPRVCDCGPYGHSTRLVARVQGWGLRAAAAHGRFVPAGRLRSAPVAHRLSSPHPPAEVLPTPTYFHPYASLVHPSTLPHARVCVRCVALLTQVCGCTEEEEARAAVGKGMANAALILRALQ
jgi:hypothetical protein